MGRGQLTKCRSQYWIVWTVAVLGFALAACGAHTPMVQIGNDVRGPAGWRGFTYGGLTIAVPAGWKLAPSPKAATSESCGGPEPVNDTVTVGTSTEGHVSAGVACKPSHVAPVDTVIVECLSGTAREEVPDPTQGSRVVIRGAVLHRYDYGRGDIWEYRNQGKKTTLVTVNAFAHPTLGAMIAATADPSAASC